MRIDILLNGNVDEELSAELRMLEDILERSDLPTLLHTMSARPLKGNLAIGIAIAGVSLSAIGIVISSLSLWLSQRPRYSVTLQRGDLTLNIGNIDRENAVDIVERLQKGDEAQPLLVRIGQIGSGKSQESTHQ